VYVNSAAKAFEAYIINGNNYFKLRDLAYVLNGTAKQFEVGYDTATKAITLTTGKAYTPDGGEMANGDGKAKTASPTASRIYLNGKELNLTVYLIGGNNFFKLRDLMEAIDVFVGYDNATKAITLDTSKGYEPEGSATPTPPATTTPEPTPTPAQPTETTQPPSGDIDTRLVGNYWYYNDNAIDRTYFYYFFEDGTAKFYEIHGGHTIVEAKFTTSNGKIYLTESYYVYDDLAGDGKPTHEKTLHGNGKKTIEYAIGTGEKGVYLQIANVVGVSEYTELPASPRKFRMAFEHDGPWK
jgi:hypothetical protein